MPQTNARNETMQQKVYQELRHSLMVGAFVPGESISLRKLAETMQTSLMPVREAVNRLIAERAFESLPNRKVIVPYLSEQKLAELMYLRKVLEGRAAIQAAKNMTPERIAEITTIDAELTQAVADNNFHLTLIKNQEFHFGIYSVSENTILLPMIESLWLQGGPSIYFSLASPNVVWNGQHHLEAIEALQAEDAKSLRKAIEQDIQTTYDFLLKSHILKRVSPRPVA